MIRRTPAPFRATERPKRPTKQWMVLPMARDSRTQGMSPRLTVLRMFVRISCSSPLSNPHFLVGLPTVPRPDDAILRAGICAIVAARTDHDALTDNGVNRLIQLCRRPTERAVQQRNAGYSCPAVACLVIHRFLSGATAPDFQRWASQNGGASSIGASPS